MQSSMVMPVWVLILVNKVEGNNIESIGQNQILKYFVFSLSLVSFLHD